MLSLAMASWLDGTMPMPSWTCVACWLHARALNWSSGPIWRRWTQPCPENFQRASGRQHINLVEAMLKVGQGGTDMILESNFESAFSGPWKWMEWHLKLGVLGSLRFVKLQLFIQSFHHPSGVISLDRPLERLCPRDLQPAVTVSGEAYIPPPPAKRPPPTVNEELEKEVRWWLPKPLEVVNVQMMQYYECYDMFAQKRCWTLVNIM